MNLRRLLSRLPFARGGRPAAVWDGGPGACVLLVDEDGLIVDASDGASALLARSRGVIPGAPFAGLFAEDDRDRALAALRSGAARRVKLSLRLPDGGRRPVELAARARGDGRRAALLLERGGGAPVSDAASEKAEALADLSHEMRTPLNAVIGFAEAMENETFGPLGDAKYREYAGHIRASGAHLLDLVTSILDLSKIRAGRLETHCELTNVGAIAEECAAMVRLGAEEAGLFLRTQIDSGMPSGWLDPKAVRQIILNLLSNAVKFTSDGGVTLRAAHERGDIVLTVTDTGIGMSAEDLEQLGARFTAAHGRGVRGAGGAGLGLALAFALAKECGGALTIDSAPGEGVTAQVRLPLRAAPSRPRRLHSVNGGADKSAPAPQPEVLTQLERIDAYRRERRASAA